MRREALAAARRRHRARGHRVAYGIWAAAGVALAAVLSKVLFREPLTLTMAAGIVLIGAGVVLVELGAAH